jgi:hypothetical protein
MEQDRRKVKCLAYWFEDGIAIVESGRWTSVWLERGAPHARKSAEQIPQPSPNLPSCRRQSASSAGGQRGRIEEIWFGNGTGNSVELIARGKFVLPTEREKCFTIKARDQLVHQLSGLLGSDE